MQWTVVIPVKALPEAKSRLAATLDDPRTHAPLVRAMRADTVSAVRRTPSVARILVVADSAGAGSDIPDADLLIVQTDPGLNSALRQAATHALQQWPQDGVAALVGDLPALRPEDLAEALDRAAEVDTAFVPDADGVGTTLLTARPTARLAPEFGEGSAARHARQAVALVGAPGLRQDVDTQTDLRRALDLGAGSKTRAVTATVTTCSR